MESEIRKDYFAERYVIISQIRRFRPMNLESKEIIEKERSSTQNCPFCKGNEHQSVEVYRDQSDWNIRVIENKYPIVQQNTQIPFFTETFFPGVGEHYVIVETPDHLKRFHELSTNEIELYLRTLSWLSEKMYKNPVIEYAHIFKNEGKMSGASLYHSHSQAIGLPFVPPRIIEIISGSFLHPGCYVEKIIHDEKSSERFVEETKHFIVFCPYASFTPYELLIIPKKHLKELSQLVKDELMELSLLLKKYIEKVFALTSSYNVMFYQAPKNHDFHMIIQIFPRITTWGGLELGTNIIVNPVSPEESAKYYREKNNE